MLEISCWMMLRGWGEQLKLIVIKSRQIIINVILCGRELTYSQYPDQVLKVICTSLVMFISLRFGFHISEKNLLDCISSCNSVQKCSENIPVLEQIVTSNEKWMLYNNVEWKRSWGKWNETPPTTSKANLHPKKVMLYLWCDWKGVLYYVLFLENQTINSNKYCSQINWRQYLTQSVQNYLTENA